MFSFERMFNKKPKVEERVSKFPNPVDDTIEEVKMFQKRVSEQGFPEEVIEKDRDPLPRAEKTPETPTDLAA